MVMSIDALIKLLLRHLVVVKYSLFMEILNVLVVYLWNV